MSGYIKIHYVNITSTTADADSVIIATSTDLDLHIPRIATTPPVYEVTTPDDNTLTMVTKIHQDAYNVDIVYPDALTQTAHLAVLKSLFLETLSVTGGNATATNQVTGNNLLTEIRNNQTDGDQVTRVIANSGPMTQTAYTITTGQHIIIPAGPKNLVQIVHISGRTIFMEFDAPATLLSARLIPRAVISFDGAFIPSNQITVSTITSGVAYIIVYTA